MLTENLNFLPKIAIPHMEVGLLWHITCWYDKLIVGWFSYESLFLGN